MLSLFLESPDVFTDEFIIDELCDFFLAASSTTQFASQTISGHFATAAASLAKVRAEFSEQCETKFDQKAGDKLAFLRSEVTSEKCQEMTYLGQVTNECLRFMNPVPHSSLMTLTQDTMIG